MIQKLLPKTLEIEKQIKGKKGDLKMKALTRIKGMKFISLLMALAMVFVLV
jgi:hypothetical protein